MFLFYFKENWVNGRYIYILDDKLRSLDAVQEGLRWIGADQIRNVAVSKIISQRSLQLT